ncbi:MAG: Na+/H+ antiporter NhaA [Chloroflexi bacterium]|nr:Na+/H+ antiporter NhaA [Chloroflexota bacterium]
MQEFVHGQASSGIVLLASAVVALVWANSLWSDAYNDLWHTEISFQVGAFDLSKTLVHWINDGVMVVFFFVIGLEIKRELLIGELSSPKQMALPLIAAVGGMAVPAIIYTAFNFQSQGSVGWGIPMATDIAFALGVLALLGSRVPLALKSFLVAVAIVDDIGAVLVIAIFYTEQISLVSLLIGLGILVILFVFNRVGVRHPLPYVLAGVFVWLAFLQSGVHATIAGVLLAATIPGRSRINTGEFLEIGREILDEYEAAGDLGNAVPVRQEQQVALQEMEKAITHVWMPLQRLEHALHPWVAFGIMPLFALANAGVSLGADFASSLLDPVSLGIISGLIIGKQIGITFAAWLAVRFELGVLPAGVTWPQIYAVAWLGGIGFTMSLFISTLAFGESSLLDVSKIGIITASILSGLVGFFLVHRFTTSA